MSRRLYLPRGRLQLLIERLSADGYRCIGPQAHAGAIVFRPLVSVDSLPKGLGDAQSPGRYRLEPSRGERLFAWANGPAALKPFTFPARETVWRVKRDAAGRLAFGETEQDAPPLAIIGVRACDLAALALHDRHFLEGAVPNPRYRRRRERLFLVAVNCSHPAATCFCRATGDGPGAESGFDLLLDELEDGYLVSVGSERGHAVAESLTLQTASDAQIAQAAEQLAEAAAAQQRRLPSRNLRDSLFSNLEHPRWTDVAERCLACGNCTAVCPTCFCHREVDEPALDGVGSEHLREWDSCFTRDHSYIHGFVVRAETRLRYRQWLTHKLGSWHEQLGRSGCVGCGRCITWCPAGIDMTEEAARIAGGGPP